MAPTKFIHAVRRLLAVATSLVLVFSVNSLASGQSQPEFLGAEELPAVVIDGQPAKIHVQGLMGTEKFWLVTGRLESPPRRPLLLRFSRSDPSRYEFSFLDLASEDGVRLDHPGGFDRDAHGVYWIPVSTSNAQGPTVILGLTIDEQRPLVEGMSILHSLRVNDHLGAICCQPKGGQPGVLWGATWDTKAIYQIRSNAAGFKIQKQAGWKSLVDDSAWQLAVQDWKFDPTRQMIVAGGIDKSPSRPAGSSKAVVGWIHPESRTVTPVRLPARDGVTRPLTNEGLAIEGDQLFLLPEDIGRGAKILRFRL